MANGQRLYRGVLEQMLQLIDAGEFPEGGRLPPERDLAERFGVSRPTIREAIIALEALERVRVKTGSGVYILKDARKTNGSGGGISAFELTEARALIEGEAAALAATMITDDELRELEAALHEFAIENAEGDLASDVADKKFHRVISRATRNKMLASVIDNLWYIRDHSPEIHKAYQAICEEDGKKRLNEHKGIFDALKKRDAVAARSAMHEHFSRILDRLIAATEAEAVEEIRTRVMQTRKRFSLEHLATEI